MKKLLLIIAAATIAFACEGPPGKDGQDGYATYYVDTFKVSEGHWVEQFIPDDQYPGQELNRYFSYTFDYSRLTQYIYKNGGIMIYRDYGDVQAPLPAVRDYEIPDGQGGMHYWSETIDYEYGVGYVTFFMTRSDHKEGAEPLGDMNFRLVMFW